MRVLVVDDDPDVLAVIQEMLSARGFEVTGSGTPDRARVRAHAEHFDVAVVDAPMPRLSGISLARELRAHGTAVLMIPAGPSIVPGIKHAALPFLMKPFKADDLATAVTWVHQAVTA
jgi:two-component system response regulator MprA